jgi:hypothetical protein
VHPKVQGLSSREIAYASGLRYLHSLPHAKRCNHVPRRPTKSHSPMPRGATARQEDLVKVCDFEKLTSNVPIRFDSSSYIVDKAVRPS